MSELTEERTKRKITNLLLSGVVQYRYSFYFPDGVWERNLIPELRAILRTIPHYQVTLARTIDSTRSKKRPRDAEPQIYLMTFSHERLDYKSYPQVAEFLTREEVRIKKDGFPLRKERLWHFAKRIRDTPLDDFNAYLGNDHNLKRVTELNKAQRPSPVVSLPRLPRKNAKNQSEAPRDLWRLQHLRKWSHEEAKQIFPRGA